MSGELIVARVSRPERPRFMAEAAGRPDEGLREFRRRHAAWASDILAALHRHIDGVRGCQSRA